MGLRAAAGIGAAVVALAVPAGAAAGSGRSGFAIPYPLGSAGMVTAVALAKQYWNADPCGGQVALTWIDDVPQVNARSSWSNPGPAYGQPALNYDCAIAFNRAAWLPWSRFCTTVVHEYGHLTGHPHTADGPDLMSPMLRAPLPACTAIPDPGSGPAR